MANVFTRTLRQVGTSTLAFVPGKVGDPYRAEVRETYANFQGPEAITWFGPPATRTEANIALGASVVIGSGAAKAAARPASRLFGRIFGRAAPKAASTGARRVAASGVDDLTRIQGNAALNQIASRPTVPLAGRTTASALSPGSKSLLVGGGAAVVAGATAPLWLGGFGKGATQAAGGAADLVQQPLTAAGVGLGDVFSGLGGGLANLFAGAGSGAGVGLGTGLTATAQGLKNVAGPVILLGGAALLAFAVAGRVGKPTRRR